MDPIANMLTQIRNALMVGHKSCLVRHSKIKENILKILKEEGYIRDFRSEEKAGKKSIRILLAYDKTGASAINSIKRISKSGRRVYSPKDKLPHVLRGIGMVLVTTSRGIMTDRKARAEGVGGEIICEVY